jgi:hypothetical protein
MVRGYYKRNSTFYRNQNIIHIANIFTWFYNICIQVCTSITKLQLFYVYDLKQRIRTAAASVEEDMLLCVWNELNYRIDICHVTKGSRIEHL